MLAALLALAFAVPATIGTPAPLPGGSGELLPYLLTLQGERVLARYTPGALDRAANAQWRLDRLTAAIERWANRPLPVELLVLSPEEWAEARLGRPYGLPARRGATSIALPAWGDDATVELARRLGGGELPALAGAPIRGTEDEAASLAFADLLAQIEVARLAVDRLELPAEPLWMREVATHLAARLAFEAYEPERARDLVRRLDRAAAAVGGPGALAVAAWSRDLPIESWLWFEAQFARGADAILIQGGERKARKLLARAAAGKDPLVAGVVAGSYPDFASWLARSFAHPQP